MKICPCCGKSTTLGSGFSGHNEVSAVCNFIAVLSFSYVSSEAFLVHIIALQVASGSQHLQIWRCILLHGSYMSGMHVVMVMGCEDPRQWKQKQYISIKLR